MFETCPLMNGGIENGLKDLGVTGCFDDTFLLMKVKALGFPWQVAMIYYFFDSALTLLDKIFIGYCNGFIFEKRFPVVDAFCVECMLVNNVIKIIVDGGFTMSNVAKFCFKLRDGRV